MMRYFWFIFYAISTYCSAVNLPDMGTSANTVFSLSEESQMGRTFFRQLRNKVHVIEDPEVNNYINSLGQRLASFSQQPTQSFQFFVIEEKSINAFAVPGGMIAIHSGLILHSRNESELASVIAHEIAHVTQRHVARTAEGSQPFSLVKMAILIAAIAVSGQNPALAEAALTSVIAGSIQMQLNFTLEHEKEADRIGMQTLAEAGYDPRGMSSFFERLRLQEQIQNNNIPSFLRTHPVNEERIAEAQDRAEEYVTKWQMDSPAYHLAKAKLWVLTEKEVGQLLKKLQSMLKEGRYRDERAVHYALALSLLQKRKLFEAEQQINWLVENDVDRVVYHSLKAQLAWLQEQRSAALQMYEQALQIYPNDALLSLEYADKLLQQNLGLEAKSLLLKLEKTGHPQYYHLLATAYQKTGELPESDLALAEHFYWSGQLELAIVQLEIARQRENLPPPLLSRIEARYQELQAEYQSDQD